MKLSKNKLKQLIKEELQTTLLEGWGDDSGCGDTSCEDMNAEIEMLRDLVRELGGQVPGQDVDPMGIPGPT